MNICVFVPSHIYYNGQIELLNKCLLSLVNQTKKVKIYVSISYDEKFKKEITDKLLMIFNKDVQFLFHKKQLFQMEHIYKLTQKYASHHDLIMFCDDDDTYKDIRVEEFCKCYEWGIKNIKYLGGVKEIIGLVDPESKAPEFWRYGIISKILIDFFERFEKNNKLELLKHIFGDMYFRYYLRRINRNNKNFGYATILIDKNENELYQYNINNENSICATIKNRNKREIYSNNLLLDVLKCVSDDEFNKLTNYLDKNSLEGALLVYRFCKNILYI